MHKSNSPVLLLLTWWLCWPPPRDCAAVSDPANHQTHMSFSYTCTLNYISMILPQRKTSKPPHFHQASLQPPAQTTVSYPEGQRAAAPSNSTQTGMRDLLTSLSFWTRQKTKSLARAGPYLAAAPDPQQHCHHPPPTLQGQLQHISTSQRAHLRAACWEGVATCVFTYETAS